MDIILASTSPYRKQILEKLRLPFQCASPNIDESRQDNESPDVLVQRLAYEKALAIAPQFDNALIIGSDQVATFEHQILGKPHTRDKAIAQLLSFSGKTISFPTGLCVFNTKTKTYRTTLDFYEVTFRTLTSEKVATYVDSENVLDCAGSIKCESLGITLIAKMYGKDPNTLIGLPLIDLIDSLDIVENTLYYSV